MWERFSEEEKAAIYREYSAGFDGDPRHDPPPGRYYGFLVSNRGYY